MREAGAAEAGLRLLFVTRFAFFPEALGGAQRSTHALLRELARRGWKVGAICRLATPTPGRMLGLGLAEAAPARRPPAPDTGTGYPCWRLIALPRLTSLGRWLDWLLVRRVYREVLRAFAPDVVLGDSTPDCPLLRTARLSGYPCIHLARALPRFATPSILPKGLHYMANAPYTAGILRAITGSEPGVTLPIVRREDYAVTREAPRYVTFVNPVPQKGAAVAVRIAQRMPDTRFLFVKGRWASMGARRCEALVQPARALPNVEVWEPQHDMRRDYEVTRVLLVPSQFLEAFGRVILEAHASGIPVVASHIAGIPFTLGQGGILVAPRDDVDGYVRALRSLESAERYEEFSALAAANSRRDDLAPGRQVEAFECFARGCLRGANGRHQREIREHSVREAQA